MRANMRTATIVIVSCAVLLAIWSLLGPAVPSKDIRNDHASEVSPSAREGRRTQPFIDQVPTPIARKLTQAPPKQNLTRAEKERRVAVGVDYMRSLHADVWFRASFSVAQYGDPDEATEEIINLIQKQEDPTADNAEFLKGLRSSEIIQRQELYYRYRLSAMVPLGLTGTERAEKFLLAAYKNPSVVEANRKHRLLFDEQLAKGNTLITPESIDLLTWRYAATGLILLDEQKYSAMIEDEFEQVKTLVMRIKSEDYNPRTEEEWVQNSKFGTLLDVLILRDVIHDRSQLTGEPRGPLTLQYMQNYQGQIDAFAQHARRYWSFPDGQGPENWSVMVD